MKIINKIGKGITLAFLLISITIFVIKTTNQNLIASCGVFGVGTYHWLKEMGAKPNP